MDWAIEKVGMIAPSWNFLHWKQTENGTHSMNIADGKLSFNVKADTKNECLDRLEIAINMKIKELEDLKEGLKGELG